jgi:hypothetical protein
MSQFENILKLTVIQSYSLTVLKSYSPNLCESVLKSV